jgi:putative addiction module killer protein
MLVTSINIKYYKNSKGEEPFKIWLSSLDKLTEYRIRAKINKILLGNLGRKEPVGNGVYEFKLYFGPGYRIYYGVISREIILLLYGGDKSTQQKDIEIAIEFWKDYQRSKKYEYQLS